MSSDSDPSASDSDSDRGDRDSDTSASDSDSDRGDRDSDTSASDSDSDVCDHGEIQNRYCETCKQFFCENYDEMHKDHKKKEYAKKELQNFKTSEDEIEDILDQLKYEIKPVKGIHKEMYKKVCHLTKWFQTRIEVQHMEPKGSIRIASWNINHAANKMRIDCMQKTIRENKFDIVALQEAGVHGRAAKKIHHELKECDDKWKLLPDKGLPTHLSGVFLWNASSKLKEIKVTIMVDCDGFAYTPCLGIFSISEWRFALLNFHLKPRFSSGRSQKKVNDKEIGLLWDAYTKAKRICKHNDVSEENIILLGDFNNIPQNVKEHGYVNTFGFKEYTNTIRDDTYDNIIVHHTLQQYCKNHGVSEIVTKKTLTPTDVSDHCPIWADFIYE